MSTDKNSETPVQLNPISRFFAQLAGSSTLILKRCPQEIAKHVNLGLVIIVTGCVSGFSMFLLVRSVDSPIAICRTCGICWGLIVVTLDRYILASYRKLDDKKKESRQMVPRLILAFILAVTITVPLELELFKNDVKDALGHLKQERIASMSERTRKELRQKMKSDSLLILAEQQNVDRRTQITNDQNNQRVIRTRKITDPDGTVRYVSYEVQRVYKGLNKDLEKSRKNIDAYEKEIAASQKKIDSLKDPKLKEYADIVNNNGMLIRAHALHDLWADDGYSFFLGIVFFLLMATLEFFPVLNKFISPATAYDRLLQTIESKAEQRKTWELTQQLTDMRHSTEKRQAEHDTAISLIRTEGQGRIDVQAKINEEFLITEEAILKDMGNKRKEKQSELNEHMLTIISKAQKKIGTKAVGLWEEKKINELPDNLDRFIDDMP